MSNALASPCRTASILGQMSNARFLRQSLKILLTRTQLITCGRHVELTTLAEQAGFQARVFMRREVFEEITAIANSFREEPGDLFQTMFALRQAVMRAPLRGCPILFQAGELRLAASIGRIDHDDPRPAITVYLPEEEA